MKDFSKEIDMALDVMFKLEKQKSKKKNLLDTGRKVYFQVVVFKIPFCAPRKRKFLRLKHSLYADDPEICLFVPNRKINVEYKKTTDELIDFCVDHYTEFLEKHKVKGITTIMPLKQLKSEYGAYELRRKLVQRFDLFLCKNSLLYNSRFLTSLGKIFRLANKEPLGVPFPKADADYDPNFQKNIEKAIFTSSFFITRFSDNYSIPIGLMSHTKEELKENMETVLEQISTEDIIPGGFKNIKTIYLWPSQSKPIPVYMSAELPVGLKARVKSKRKREAGIEGELSTQPDKKVFVMPNGEVFVTKIKNKKNKSKAVKKIQKSKVESESESEGEDSFDDGSGEENDKDEKGEEENDDIDDDDDGDDAEETEWERIRRTE